MKLFIFGGPGSGKTTLARQLADQFNLPLFELDKLFHSGEGAKQIIDIAERTKIIDELLKHEKTWVIEGLYRDDWLNKVLANADIILYLNTPFLKRVLQTTRRTIGWMFSKNSPRDSSFASLSALIKLNRRFEKVHKPEFNERLAKLNVKPIVIKSFDDALAVLEKRSLSSF